MCLHLAQLVSCFLVDNIAAGEVKVEVTPQRRGDSAVAYVGPYNQLKMAYNLYQVQMANAWAERIVKETAQAEKFWHQQSVKVGGPAGSPTARGNPIEPYYGEAQEVRSVAGSGAARSAAPTGFTSKTSFLRTRMEKLEAELMAERESRRKVEEDLQQLRTNMKR